MQYEMKQTEKSMLPGNGGRAIFPSLRKFLSFYYLNVIFN
jgi:hypothetical protein